ncbi:MAG: VWA domain-containing protein [Bacteroidales bacterium]|nr:VWA domain-containing protein [Bacteroidales bacterium]
MESEILRRWRLILGGECDGTGCELNGKDLDIDQSLEGVYGVKEKGGLGKSSPKIAKWIGEIRNYFPPSVVSLIQKDAIKRLKIKELLTEKELLESVVPDINLVTTLMSLSKTIPEQNKETAKKVVKQVVDELMQKLLLPMQQAIRGALNRSIRTRNPKFHDIDWNTTILKNLKNYQPSIKKIIPETTYGFGRKRHSIKDIIICLDQSASMDSSIVFASIYASVLASMPSLNTKVVAFDTEVVDLTNLVHDPVDLLFGIQLGGGTDIHKALCYCNKLITKPKETIMIVISDLFEGGNEYFMFKKFEEIKEQGVNIITLLSLTDSGTPQYCRENAQKIANQGIPTFSCSPDKFPEIMSQAINNQEININ